jgi:hypothetical protein
MSGWFVGGQSKPEVVSFPGILSTEIDLSCNSAGICRITLIGSDMNNWLVNGIYMTYNTLRA